MASSTESIPELIQGVNSAFKEFRSKNDERLNLIEKQLETDAVRAAAEKLGGVNATPQNKFQAHYSRKADYHASNDPIDMQSFLRGIAGLKSTDAVRAALAGGLDTSGGFTIPSRLAPSILDAMTAQSSVLNAGAGIQLIEPSSTFTTAAVDAVPSAAWRLEAGGVVESDPSFRAVVAAPKSLAFFFKISRELLADGTDLSRALTTAIAQSFALALDAAALRGSGTAPTPRGLLNTVGVHAIASGANGASLVGHAKLFEAVTAILGADHQMPTAAIMNPRTLVDFGSMTDSNGQPLNTPPMLSNIKMLQTTQVPIDLTVGTSTDCSEIYVGDFSQLQFIIRENVSIQLLRERFAESGQLAFLGHVRADVAVMRPKSFAVVTGVR